LLATDQRYTWAVNPYPQGDNPGIIGSILGITLGAVTAEILSRSFKWPISVSISSVVLALVFSAGVGIFFGFYPAWKASRLDPIEALRYE